LTSAVARLRALTTVLAGSALYASEAIGGPVQGAFLNAAVKLRWSGKLIELLDALRDIEAAHGRGPEVRAAEPRWGPRRLDLDILWAQRTLTSGPGKALETITHDEPRLSVPHPRLRERAFALRPLLDVDAAAVDPISGRPYRQILSELKHQRISKVAFDEWPFASVPVD